MIEDRLAQIEADIAVLKNEVQNHIPSRFDELRAWVKSIDGRLWWLLGGIALANIGAWFR